MDINWTRLSLRFLVIAYLGIISPWPALLVGTVQVRFGHWLQPVLTRTQHLIVLNNSFPVVPLKCVAQSPTEWIANFENVEGRQEWTDRKFDTSIDEPSYLYVAWMELTYKRIDRPLSLVCRSVANGSEFVLVEITPALSSNEVLISTRPQLIQEFQDPHLESQNQSCKVQFLVVESGSEYFWWCKWAEFEPGTVSGTEAATLEIVRACNTSSECANTFRDLRTSPACVSEFNNLTSVVAYESSIVYLNSSWIAVSAAGNRARAGIALCTINEVRAAVEFFFEGVRNGTKRTMHLSQSTVTMENLIWMDPSPLGMYYVSDSMNARCVVPKYGFSFDSVVIVTLNGTRIYRDERGFQEMVLGEEPVWVREVSVSFTEFGAGLYQVQCIAPVWNTTEWANHTRSSTVQAVIVPHFETGNEDRTYQVGDRGKELTCDATGDPMPSDVTWHWDTNIYPGTPKSRTILKLPSITAVYGDTIINCTATNRFGHSALKSFSIHVAPEIASSPTTNILIISIASIVGVFIAVAVSLTVLFRILRSPNLTRLTNEEVDEFNQGRCTLLPNYVQLEDMEGPLEIEYVSYNRSFEVKKKNFFVDYNCELGCGEYGVVYKGRIKMGRQKPVEVAVKTVRTSAGVDYFKALMSELKILAHIGHHPGIANLVGAFTANIKNRELLVGVELCEGSLLQFLRDHEGEVEEGAVNTQSLLMWAVEIAEGMEFLASKRIVHGDLAARNILLSFELHAKVSDFGLARQLVDYVYIKSQDCPLPWRWMALESFLEKEFSTKSDVWGYGVVLWEIFSLGGEPYDGLPWSIDFPNQLLNGLRLPRPEYASEIIYQMMTTCWQESREGRPIFADLRQFFVNQNQMLVPDGSAH